MRIRPMGARALLVEVDDPPAWFAEVSRWRAAGHLSVVDLVPGARTLLLDGLADLAAATEMLRSSPAPAPIEMLLGNAVRIPVDFDGEDLRIVAALWHTDEAGVVSRLTTTELTVAFCGFTPGFGYLTGLPVEWAVPRLETPRPKVPAGSVALADSYAGIYPTASPGGWRLVGRTEVTLFDPDRTPPALLVPGTRVQLVARSVPRDIATDEVRA